MNAEPSVLSSGMRDGIGIESLASEPTGTPEDIAEVGLSRETSLSLKLKPRLS
jgi:hypothetical protein